MPGATSGIQTFVNRELPVGVAGDFAGANIRASVVAGAFAWLASPGGVNIGGMGWCDPVTGLVSSYYKPNSAPGLIHRKAAQTIITQFLGVDTVTVPGGYEATPMSQGDFWGNFPSGATVGQKVYANPTTGALTSAATGGSVVGSLSSGGASIASGVLTTTDADASGSAIAVGQVVVDSGGNVPPGTYIASAAGTGTGTHLWNLANIDGSAIPNVSAGTLTWKFYGATETPYYVGSPVAADPQFTASLAPTTGLAGFSVLTVTAVASGVIIPQQWLYSTAGTPLLIGANVKIQSQLTSTASGGALGSTGTYLVTGTNTISSQTFNSTQGKLGKISSWSAF